MNSKCLISIAIGIALAIFGVKASPYGDSYIRDGDRKNHDLFMGSSHGSDPPTVREHVEEKYEFLRKQNIERTFFAPVGQVITGIHALDQNNEGHGAEPTVTQGGIGQNSVTLRFESQRSYGIDFVVKLFTYAPHSE